MKKSGLILIVIMLTLISQYSFSQTDSLHLLCPFENGSGREPKEAFTWDPPEKKIIMVTKMDTIIRSCIGDASGCYVCDFDLGASNGGSV